MLSPEFRDILSDFTAEGVDFLVVGAYAMAAHGFPRATGDLDLWVRTDPVNARRVFLALVRFGAPLKDIREEEFRTPGWTYQLGVPPVRIDVLTAIDGVEFDDAWRRRRRLQIEGIRVPVLGRKDLITNKKATGRPKDLLDAAILEERVSKPRRARKSARPPGRRSTRRATSKPTRRR